MLSPELGETVVEESVVGDDVADTESKKVDKLEGRFILLYYKG